MRRRRRRRRGGGAIHGDSIRCDQARPSRATVEVPLTRIKSTATPDSASYSNKQKSAELHETTPSSATTTTRPTKPWKYRQSASSPRPQQDRTEGEAGEEECRECRKRYTPAITPRSPERRTERRKTRKTAQGNRESMAVNSGRRTRWLKSPCINHDDARVVDVVAVSTTAHSTNKEADTRLRLGACLRYIDGALEYKGMSNVNAR